MPKIAYLDDKNFRDETLALMRRADVIATDYARRGYSLTLRQLYYQLVSQAIIPNTEASYNKLGRTVSDGRLYGLIDWNHLEDRGRTVHGIGWRGHKPDFQADIIEQAKYKWTLDLWKGQERRVEVWVEKQALEEVAQRATQSTRSGYFACKGYVSQSEMWASGVRVFGNSRAGQSTLILHLGDHDPSGIDMTRDIEERLSLFSGSPVEIKRIALNMDQIEEFNPPPNPAKMTDSRYRDYRDQYGTSSWELDALRPEMLVELIEDEIKANMDVELFNSRLQIEREAQGDFETIAERWEEVVDLLDLPDRDVDA